MPPSRHARLAELLDALFDPDALRRFVLSFQPLDRPAKDVPGGDVGPAQLTTNVVDRLARRGLVNAALFKALLDERPARIGDIAAVAQNFGIEIDSFASSEGPSIATYRRSIGLLRADALHGCTAWLVAPDLAVTTREAIARLPAGLPLALELDDVTIGVHPIEAGTEDGCVLISLRSPAPDRRGLPIAERCAGRAAAWTVGYSRARREWAVPLGELLIFPAPDGEAITLHSEVLSSHMDSSHHCFAGAPLFVEDHVVAMIGRRIERDDDPGRSLSGLVQAWSVRPLLARLGRAADRAEVGIDMGSTAPAIADEQFHTFIAYATPDTGWARRLEERLTLEGFRVFVGEPGRPAVASDGPLVEALRRSRSALVLHSRAWEGSPACAPLRAALLQRRARDPEFRLILIRLDDATVAAPWDQCHSQDFRGARGPYGSRWDDLVHALVWRAAPPPTTTKGALGSAETSATDTMEADLWAAAQVDATEVVSVWRGWERAGALALAPSMRAAEYLISQSRADLALEILQTAGSSTRAEQLRALALSRTGKDEQALRILERLHTRGVIDAETMGLLAGRYKRLWTADGRRSWLERAHALYLEAFERFGESYTGINAAALALYLGQRELSERTARDVVTHVEALPERSLDHWQLATLAEAWHLLRDVEKAAARYAEAVRLNPEFYSDIAAMRMQARRNARCLGDRESLFDAILAIPRVVAFVGHMEDLKDRPTPRFPPGLVGPVREAIRTRLRDLSAGFGFCSLARGADILFVEEMLARRSHVRAFLPFPAADFEHTSVGPHWAPRFREALADPRVEVQALADERPPESDLELAFYSCTHAIARRAIEFAQGLGEVPILLAVWDGNPGDGVGGTADAVTAWRRFGYELSQIDLGALRRALTPALPHLGDQGPSAGLTVLMVSASPISQDRLRVDKEFRRIIDRMRGTRFRDRFQFVQVLATSFDHLRTALLDHQPHVLHISSHGQADGSLIFEGDHDSAEQVPKKNLLALLEQLRDNLRLVVVNACDSQAFARDIPPTIGLAIGMSDRVTDDAAIDFAVAFYEALGFARPVETAFKLALAGLRARDSEIPQLYPATAEDAQERRKQPLIAP